MVTFNLPVDLAGILASALAGGVVGFFLVYIVNWLWRPKVRTLGWARVPVNFGTLYKLRFTVKGRLSPGLCALEIEWNGRTVFAKWDETPNPLEQDDPSRFRPELVPGTYYQPLFTDREYIVPIVIERDDICQVFSSWWFGWGNGYGSDPTVNRRTDIRLTLAGGDLRWSATFRVDDIIRSAINAEVPPAGRQMMDADNRHDEFRLWIDLMLHWERNIYARSHFFFVGHAFLLSAFFQSFVGSRTRASLLLSLAGVGLSLILLYIGLREWHAQNLASNRLEALASENPALEPLLEVRRARRNLPLLSESVFVIVAVGLPLFLLGLWSLLALGAWRKFCAKATVTPDWVARSWLPLLLAIIGFSILIWPVLVRRIEGAFRTTWAPKANVVKAKDWRTKLVACLTGVPGEDADPRILIWLEFGLLLALAAIFFCWVYPLPC